ncbi:DNA-binding protein [Mycobacteroides chelonae]|uniref:DNA-binding protein n=1 Tax=Mycobacteroides chelonae TaxID=1774 RepID=UPI0009BE5EC7|nr:DNA-binding protein [Mycobacteroides chelonae]
MKCKRPSCHRAGIRRRQGLCNPHYELADRGYVDAGPVRDHITQLHAVGHSWAEIAKQAGISRSGLDRIRDASYSSVLKVTAARVLAIPMRVGHTATIDATGTVRRLQALTAIGWSIPRLAKEIGITPSTLENHLHRSTVSTSRAGEIAQLFSRLQMTPGPSKRLRTLANQKGRHPPFAWDEDTIDDPNATPDLGGKSTWMQAYEDYQWVCRDDAQIAAAMDIQLDSVKTQLRRKGAA